METVQFMLCALVSLMPILIPIKCLAIAIRERRFTLQGLFWFVTLESAALALAVALRKT
jgi:hypothetical protein